MSPDIHWHIGEDAEQETIASTAPARHSRRSWVAILIVVILGAGLGAVYRSIPEPAPRPTPAPSPTPYPTPALPAIPAKLYVSIDREAQALASGAIETVMALHTPQEKQVAERQRLDFRAWGRPSDGRPLYTIVDFNLRSQTNAWADVRQFRNGRWFRETRFYVRENDRWLRSDPDPFFWSDQTETLDTPHFHVIYAVEDRDLIQPIVGALERAYPQACRDLGCMEAAAALTYTLKLNGTSLNGLRLSGDARELTFPSPRLTGIFEDGSLDGNYLVWSITIAAAQRAYYGAATQWHGGAPGHVVFNSVVDWAMAQLRNEPKAPSLTAAYLQSQELVPLEDLWGKAYLFDEERKMIVLRTDSNVIYPEGALVTHFIEQE
jgi:hypothetical protein